MTTFFYTDVCSFSCELSHLLTSVHFLAVPVTVAWVGVHADQRASRVSLVTRSNCQGGEGWCGKNKCRHQCPDLQLYIR